jgi:hypothetical protein
VSLTPQSYDSAVSNFNISIILQPHEIDVWRGWEEGTDSEIGGGIEEKLDGWIKEGMGGKQREGKQGGIERGKDGYGRGREEVWERVVRKRKGEE